MGKIIALAGRKFSGKSELANICIQKYGFKLLPMAAPLKELVSHLVGFDVNQSQESKERKINLILDKEQQKFLSEETNIDIDLIKLKTDNYIFRDVRQALQYIGTDIIRLYNPIWHVNKVRNMIEQKYNYICDDLRFQNEYQMFKDLNADCWFITRPKIDDISNHISETSLSWKDFGDKIIINNLPLAVLKNNFENYVEHVIFNNDLTNPIMKCASYSEIRNKICSKKEYVLYPFSIEKDEEISDSTLRMLRSFLMIPIDYFAYDQENNKFEDDFPYKDDKTLKIDKNNFLTIKIKNKRKIIADNVLVIENIKKFL